MVSNKPAKQSFKLDFNWKITLFSVLFLPLLIKLGFWQLSRADEKRTLQEEWEAQQALPALGLNELSSNQNLQFRRVALQGKFELEKFWLMENQVYQGLHGYHVLMPFHLNNGETLLVNRGWVQGSGYRTEIPSFDTPSSVMILEGSLVEPSQNVLLAEDQSELHGQWPRYTLSIDLPTKSQALDKALGAKYLQLSAESSAALAINWAPINMSPEKHTGYATQWFSMAFVLVILTIFANSNLGSLLVKTKIEDQETE